MTNLLLFAAGLAGLIVGAELLVRGASKLALSLGLSPLVVGLTIVAFGTSSPELAVSVGAVLDGRTDLAIGNVVGSNVFNVLFILGVSALITPLLVDSQIIRQEVPIMLGTSLLLVVLCLDARLSAWDGAMLFTLMLAYTVFLVRQSRAQTRAEGQQQAAAKPAAGTGESAAPPAAAQRHWDDSLPVQIVLVLLGLVALVFGSDWLVTASIAFAQAMGVSDLVIGLTIVAAGTSMPEVAASVTAALRGQRDIAIGNVIGSNIFNILGCLGIASLLSGAAGLNVPPAVLNFDVWVMLAVALACLPIFLTGRQISRWEGVLFLGYYAAYVGYLILAAQQHDALPAYSATMLGFVVPLTMVTLVVSIIRPARTS